MSELQMDAPIYSFADQVQQEPQYEFQPAQPNNLVCHWNNCLKEFPSHSALSSHLSEDHVGWKKTEYICEWDNCSRQGTKCHNRFALMMHLRIHTGEKPFECTYPNCGQSFGRTDALIRHKKAEHGEEMPMSPTPSANKTKRSSNKRTLPSLDMLSKINKKQKHKVSSSSGDEDSDDSLDEIPKRTTPSKPLIPGSDYSQYRLAKAQLNYILRENQMLQDELETTQKKLKRMKTERKVLLEAVMAADSNNQAADDIPDLEDQI